MIAAVLPGAAARGSFQHNNGELHKDCGAVARRVVEQYTSKMGEVKYALVYYTPVLRTPSHHINLPHISLAPFLFLWPALHSHTAHR